MSPFLLRASSASGSVVLPRVPLVGSGFAAGLGSMTAGPRSAPRSAAGGGSTRRLGVVAAVALGVGGQAWVGAERGEEPPVISGPRALQPQPTARQARQSKVPPLASRLSGWAPGVCFQPLEWEPLAPERALPREPMG